LAASPSQLKSTLTHNSKFLKCCVVNISSKKYATFVNLIYLQNVKHHNSHVKSRFSKVVMAINNEPLELGL
jgi:hypothetical protein